MTTTDLLAALLGRGVILSIHGDRLRLEAPTGTITPDLRAEVAEHKAELLAALSVRESVPSPSTDAERTADLEATGTHANPFVCPFCGTSTWWVDGDLLCCRGCQPESPPRRPRPGPAAAPLPALWTSRLHEARNWVDLHAVLDDAQTAFAHGTLRGDEVERIARQAQILSRSVPEGVR